MKFIETPLKGAFIIEPEPVRDQRGFFSRTWCKHEFAEHELAFEIVQCSISYNVKKGTLRGMHYQSLPHEEAKLVSCIRGSIYDVIVDLRPDSSTYIKWFSLELNETNRRFIYIPKGFAHGFQSLEDNTEVFYQISEFYNPNSSKGILWNDASLQINWPLSISEISDKDLSYKQLENT